MEINKIKKFINKPLGEKINFIKYTLDLIKTQLIYKYLFKELGRKTCISKPLRIINHKNMIIKNNVLIWPNARIEAVNIYNDRNYSPMIVIDSGVSIQQNLHLTCAIRVYIGKNTAIASNVTITDIHHNYLDINIPIEKQDIVCNEVSIGEDCKIYNNSVILPGVSIGKHCTIGANSVVNKSIPDYSVAVGLPAKVVKRYNFKTNKWEKVN